MNGNMNELRIAFFESAGHVLDDTELTDPEKVEMLGKMVAQIRGVLASDKKGVSDARGMN